MADDVATVEHMLRRLTFGPRPGEVGLVAAQGLTAWLEAQLNPGTIDDSALEQMLPPDPVPPASFASNQEARRFGRQLVRVMATHKFLRATYSERALETVLVDFWFNHFNAFAAKGLVGLYLADYERAAIRPRVLGSFRDLLGAIAKSPAMLIYLDNWLSTGPQPAGGRGRAGGLNENYARELLELHTLGVDGGYTQDDVVEVARAFTGWTVDLGTSQFRFANQSHDPGAKTVLGVPLTGGGIDEGEQVLDLLAAHPSTARFLAVKLARRFVSDDPPESLVTAIADRYLETGGNLREVMVTLVSAQEFLDPAVRYAKFKTPLEFTVSLFRATGSALPATRTLNTQLDQLGMEPYQCLPPTGYATEALVWLSPGAVIARMNAVLQYAGTTDLATVGTPEFQYR